MLKSRTVAAGLAVLAATIIGAGAAAAAPGHAVATVNLRAGPGTGYPVIAVVGAGDPAVIHGCRTDGRWCEVSADGHRGWAAGRYLKAAYRGDERGPVDVTVNSYRHRQPPPLQLGPLKGPPLNPTEPQVGLPYLEPPPHRCGIGQYPANGSCL